MNNMIASILRARGIDPQQAMQNPYGMVQQMMQSGQVSQQQVNALYQQAQQFQNQGQRGPLGMFFGKQ